MITQTQVRKYEMRGNPIFQEVPQIDNHRHDETRQEILAIHNERFRGDSRIADFNKYKKGQPLIYSNTPRALSYEQRAKDLGITEFHVLSPEEVVQHWEVLPERDSTYADTNSVALFPNPSPNPDNEILRKIVLDILGMKRAEGPFKVSGLDVFPAENSYKFTFAETGSTRAEEAPYLKQDGKVSYNGTQLVSSEEGVQIWVPGDQSGLRWFYRNGSGGLYAGDDYLLGSLDSGRVQIFYDPQGRAENLESRLSELNAQREQQIAEIDARYRQASGFLRTGRFQ